MLEAQERQVKRISEELQATIIKLHEMEAKSMTEVKRQNQLKSMLDLANSRRNLVEEAIQRSMEDLINLIGTQLTNQQAKAKLHKNNKDIKKQLKAQEWQNTLAHNHILG